MKTGTDFEEHIYRLVNNSPIRGLITGKVYLGGLRPVNSKLEDAVISYQTGLSDQIQTGNVNVNIFVPDIVHVDEGGAKVNIKNFQRCSLIERACQDFISSQIANEYRLGLATTIQTFEHEAGQHFINMRIRYRYTSF